MNHSIHHWAHDRGAPPRSARHAAQAWPIVLFKGALAGAAATAAMSAAMLLAQRLGLLGRAPPRHIVEHALHRVRLHEITTRSSRKLLTAAAHAGFGVTQGAFFAALNHAPVAFGRRALVPSATGGVAFGLLVWAASYAGWIPLLGILPEPSSDRAGRPTSMIIAHIIYGLVLAKSLHFGEQDGSDHSKLARSKERHMTCQAP